MSPDTLSFATKRSKFDLRSRTEQMTPPRVGETDKWTNYRTGACRDPVTTPGAAPLLLVHENHPKDQDGCDEGNGKTMKASRVLESPN